MGAADWQLYDTHYTERYLGDPRTDPQSYATSEAIKEAAKIRDPLMLIHGMADDNVFLDNATACAAEMQKTDTPFEMMLYPVQEVQDRVAASVAHDPELPGPDGEGQAGEEIMPSFLPCKGRWQSEGLTEGCPRWR